MRDIPDRLAIYALTEAVHAISPVVTLGFAHRSGEHDVSILYSTPMGFGQYLLPAADVPSLLHAPGNAIQEADRASIYDNADGVFEWHLRVGNVQRVVSLAVPDVEPATRFWIGLLEPAALKDSQKDALREITRRATPILTTPLPADKQAEQHRRLEMAAELLRELLRVLDVREVFNRLSAVAQKALPHDLLMLRFLTEDFSKIVTLARTGGGADLDIAVPHIYPPAVTRAWNFDIIDDYSVHPQEQNKVPATLGVRSSLRLPIRFDDRVIGGLAFLSREPRNYGSSDVVVARRLADHVAVALSHHNLAQQFAKEARNAEALRTRTTSLELLDVLLVALMDTGSLEEVLERISDIAGKVLTLTDCSALLLLRLPDGKKARVYASRSFPAGRSEVVEMQAEILESPNWEQDVFDDLTLRSEPRYEEFASLGFRSLLQVPVRMENQLAGTLVFLSKEKSAFIQADAMVARRIADRLTVSLVREREIAASRRADEAAERAARLEARVRELTEELDSRTGYRRVIGESMEWRQVLKQATQVAATETTVLLLGESGTGKEVIARFVHRASSRSKGPFVALNCAALPEHLLEAELFGYERGAFTGAMQSKPGQLEQAAGGTLFLDEVGEMTPSSQAKFLRVLQEREFQRLGGTRVIRADTRIVAATNRDLQRAITQGQFREDLYYRLNVFAIKLPALRSRRDDILPLSEAFLGEIGKSVGRPPSGISRDARQMLMDYHWPGNVRELRNILERAAILCDGGLITADHLALTVTPALPPLASSAQRVVTGPIAAAAAAAPPPPPSPGADLPSMERSMIEQALEKARFNKSRAAKALGLTRHQLYVRMRKYGFE